MRVIVTGSRDWADAETIRRELCALPSGSTVVHGDADGADRLAGDIARRLGYVVESYPADWKHLGRSAGPVRNSKMVKLGADLCLAFWNGTSTGTLDCMGKAGRAGIRVHIIRAMSISA